MTFPPISDIIFDYNKIQYFNDAISFFKLISVSEKLAQIAPTSVSTSGSDKVSERHRN